MSRLFAALTLWLLLLFAAPPASGMMSVPPENRTREFFSPTSFEQGGGWLWNQDCIRDAAPCDYDFASDVRDGPNLYAYVKQNPWTSWDPHGLAETSEVYRTPEQQKDGGATRLEADKYGKPIVEKGSVLAHNYSRWNKWTGTALSFGESSSGWEPAEKYISQPTSSAKNTFETANDPQRSTKAFTDASSTRLADWTVTASKASVEVHMQLLTMGILGGVVVAAESAAAKTTAGAADDILLLGRGKPDVLKPMADQLGARVIDTPLRGKELYKHIYSEMRKSDGIIQITDNVPNALIIGEKGQWSRMEKLLIDNVESLRAKTVRGSKADFGLK